MKTFEELVEEIGLIKAVIKCSGSEINFLEKDSIKEWFYKRRPAIPEGILEKLSFEEWIAIAKNHKVDLASNLYKTARQKMSELANTPEQCENYLRFFGVEDQLDRKVIEKLILKGDFSNLLAVRCLIPYKDSLVMVWMKRLIELADKSGHFSRWTHVCEVAEVRSPERKLALRKMCEMEGLPVTF